MNLKGQALATRDFPTRPEQGLAEGVNRIYMALYDLVQEGECHLDGIGIGCTGRIDPWERTLAPNAFLPGWEGPGLVRMLAQKFNVPVTIDNDVVAAAAGAAVSELARGAENLLYVTVSTGIGGAQVVNGRVYRGSGSAHPELGHHVIDPSGPACYCGAHGCWQSLASGTALAEWYRQRVGATDPLKDTKTHTPVSARDVCFAAESGDPVAREAVERTGHYLGLGLANLITLYVPDVLMLGGGLMKKYVLFSETIQSTVQQVCGMVPFERVRWVVAPDAEFVLSGAVELWKQRDRI
jgi:glucokinase